MRLLASLVILIFVWPATLLAKNAETTGWITAIDQDNDLISLDTGQVFTLSDDINIASVTEGSFVTIIFEDDGINRIALDIATATKPPSSIKTLRDQKNAEICAVVEPGDARAAKPFPASQKRQRSKHSLRQTDKRYTPLPIN